jgi:flagellar FliL protein
MTRPPAALLLLALLCPAPAVAAASQKPPEPAAGGLHYVALSPALVSNLQSDGKKARFVRCEIQLMSEQPGATEQLDLHAPPLRHALLLLLAEQDAKAMQTPEGKDGLRRTALETVRAVLQDKTGQPWIDDLYFTSFYVQ